MCTSTRDKSGLFEKLLAATFGTKKEVGTIFRGFQGIPTGDKDFANRVLHQLIGGHLRSGLRAGHLPCKKLRGNLLDYLKAQITYYGYDQKTRQGTLNVYTPPWPLGPTLPEVGPQSFLTPDDRREGRFQPEAGAQTPGKPFPDAAPEAGAYL
jgi:hypothetical protein